MGTLFVTGIVNAWMLVGSVRALLFTEYGQLLTLKLIVFGLMLMFAAFNRFCLTPQLSLPIEDKARIESLRQLTRNSATEFALGLGDLRYRWVARHDASRDPYDEIATSRWFQTGNCVLRGRLWCIDLSSISGV